MNIMSGHFGGPADINESPWVTLTDAQIKGLPVTPVRLLEAPGPHRIITPLDAMVLFNNSAGGYDNGNVTGAVLDIGLGTLLADVIYNTYLQSPSYQLLLPLTGSSLTMIGLSSFTRTYGGENSPVSIAMFTDAGTALTGGNSGNTLKVKLWYSVVPL